MEISGLIELESIRCDVEARSKKHALDILSELLAKPTQVLTSAEIFDSLVTRERLGCTTVGGAVAIPHGRINGIDRWVGAFLRLTNSVDFDDGASDPVDLILGLIIPEASADAELTQLKVVAGLLADSNHQRLLREALDEQEVYDLLLSFTQSPERRASG